MESEIARRGSSKHWKPGIDDWLREGDGWRTVFHPNREDDSPLPFFNSELPNPESSRIIGDRSLGAVKSNGISSKRGRGSEISYLGLSGVGFE